MPENGSYDVQMLLSTPGPSSLLRQCQRGQHICEGSSQFQEGEQKQLWGTAELGGYWQKGWPVTLVVGAQVSQLGQSSGGQCR